MAIFLNDSFEPSDGDGLGPHTPGHGNWVRDASAGPFDWHRQGNLTADGQVEPIRVARAIRNNEWAAAKVRALLG